MSAVLVEHKGKHSTIKKKIGFIGAGNMTKAIATGMLDSGVILPDLIQVSAPSDNNLGFWKEKGVFTTHKNDDIVRNCDVIVLGMKPQYLDDALKSLNHVVPENKLIISILAGITIQTLNEKLRTHLKFYQAGMEPWRIVRVIPNTPIMVGAGATDSNSVMIKSAACLLAYAVSESATAEDSRLVETMFSAGGVCEAVPERLMNAVGALSGSGPAYVYLIIEALCDGGVKMGIPRALATKLACQTLLGAAKMVQETGRHPGQLKDEVCSPGGTTITGVHVLEQSGVRAALISAVETATNRSFELGNK